MFTIQYQDVSGAHRMQTLDAKNRAQLIRHLTHFQRPIVAIHEQVTVITKTIRAELAKVPANKLSRAAREFVHNR